MDDDQEVRYGFDDLDELTHAYALTVHRSQGSEYPCVVVPLTQTAWLMLQRNLLYTAVTRARQLVVLVGSRRALAKAIRTPATGTATPPSTTACDGQHPPGSRRPAARPPTAPGVTPCLRDQDASRQLENSIHDLPGISRTEASAAAVSSTGKVPCTICSGASWPAVTAARVAWKSTGWS